MTALSRQVDRLFAEWDRSDAPGCAVGVVQDGALVHARGYGLANLDYDIPITPDSVFYVASVSKQFVATSILLLVGDGALSLEDDVRVTIPELPDYGNGPIRIRHLIHHTSGLRDYLALMELAGWSFEDYFAIADALEVMSRQRGVNAQPGVRYEYCNSGYVLLAEIVRRVSGTSLRAFAEARIFRPLGMHSTRFDDDRKQVVKRRVVSYAASEAGGFRRYLKNFDAVGSGGLLTSVNDLYLWDQNFSHGRVGGSGLLARIAERGRLEDGELLDYACGLEWGRYRGLLTLGHAGEMLGFRTRTLRFPEQRFAVVCLANLETIDATGLAYQVADCYLSDRFLEDVQPPATPVDLPEPDLQGLAGLYQSARSGMFLELGLEDGQLVADVLGRTVRLAPLGPTRFRVLEGPGPFQVAFDVQEGDSARVMRLIRPHEKEDVCHPVEPAHLAVDELAAYTGAYYSDELRVTYRLVLQEGKLYCHYRNGPERPLRPGPTDRLWLPNAVFAFERDPNGIVSGMAVHTPRARGLSFVKMDG